MTLSLLSVCSPRAYAGRIHSPVSCGSSHLRESPDTNLCWRGVLAKVGVPVCRARGVTLGKCLESTLPEVVNCSARIDLDMLAKCYGESIGFDIVFFLPDSEDDFASYTKFFQSFVLKNRVGVAKCDDGTNLFLVPPCDFLTSVLKVSGPQRLYGVVLKYPQRSTLKVQQPEAAAHYIEQRQELTFQNSYNYVHQNEEPPLRTSVGAQEWTQEPPSDQLQEQYNMQASYMSGLNGPDNSMVPNQQTQEPVYSSAQGETLNFLPNQVNLNPNVSDRGQRLQVAVSSSAEGPSGRDSEKSWQYHATLHLAASLLQKIQQQSQGSGGSGNQ